MSRPPLIERVAQGRAAEDLFAALHDELTPLRCQPMNAATLREAQAKTALTLRNWRAYYGHVPDLQTDAYSVTIEINRDTLQIMPTDAMRLLMAGNAPLRISPR